MKMYLTHLVGGVTLLCFSLLTLPSCNLPDEPDDPYNNENSGGNSTTDPDPYPTPSPDPDPDPDPNPTPGPAEVELIFSYQIDNKTYEMIRVDVPEGYPFKTFYMMQTEMPIDKAIKFGKYWMTPLDSTSDGIITKGEMEKWLPVLREMTNLPFRLPTVAEWQFAAAGGIKGKGYPYAGSNDISEVAWYKDNANGVLHAIATKKPNELGFYDMCGNYAELCSDPERDICFVDGSYCGGSYRDIDINCTVVSVQPGKGGLTKIPGTNYFEGGAVDSRYIGFRFIYSLEEI